MKRLIATPVVLVLGILIFSLLAVFTEPLRLFAEEEQHAEEEITHRIPQKYGTCVERLSSIKNELTELTRQYRLYQFHEPLELFDAILNELSHKAEADIFNPMRSEIKESVNIINQLALRIDHAGDEEKPEDFLRAVNQLEPVFSSLNKFVQFANNQEIEVPHNVPNTFRRMLTRNRGVLNSLKEIANKGYFYKAHEDVAHLENMADNLEKAFEINVIKNLENTRLQPNIYTLKQISKTLHESSDKEDRTQTLQTIEKYDFEYSLSNLNQLRFVIAILFSMRLELQEDLENGNFSEQLRQQFTNNNILLPQNVAIRVKEEQDTWVVHNKGGIILYVIKKEDDSLNTYRFVGQQFVAQQEVGQQFVAQQEVEGEVDHLLKRAEQLYKERRLTIPSENNAFKIYKRVLEIDPDNKQAKKGIEKIADWYVHRAEEHVANEEWDKVETYVKLALSVDPDNQKAKELLNSEI